MDPAPLQSGDNPADWDLYLILGITDGPSATTEALRIAYRERSRQIHPDRNPDDPDAGARFDQLKQAYVYLTDPENRASYNAVLTVAADRARAHAAADEETRRLRDTLAAREEAARAGRSSMKQKTAVEAVKERDVAFFATLRASGVLDDDGAGAQKSSIPSFLSSAFEKLSSTAAGASAATAFKGDSAAFFSSSTADVDTVAAGFSTATPGFFGPAAAAAAAAAARSGAGAGLRLSAAAARRAVLAAHLQSLRAGGADASAGGDKLKSNPFVALAQHIGSSAVAWQGVKDAAAAADAGAASAHSLAGASSLATNGVFVFGPPLPPSESAMKADSGSVEHAAHLSWAPTVASSPSDSAAAATDAAMEAALGPLPSRRKVRPPRVAAVLSHGAQAPRGARGSTAGAETGAGTEGGLATLLDMVPRTAAAAAASAAATSATSARGHADSGPVGGGSSRAHARARARGGSDGRAGEWGGAAADDELDLSHSAGAEPAGGGSQRWKRRPLPPAQAAHWGNSADAGEDDDGDGGDRGQGQGQARARAQERVHAARDAAAKAAETSSPIAAPAAVPAAGSAVDIDDIDDAVVVAGHTHASL